MRLLHSLAKIHATFDDPNLVSRAGLAPVMALAQRAGLAALAGEHVRIGRRCGVNAQVKVPGIVAGMIGGADSIDDLGLLRHGAMPALFGDIVQQFGERPDECVRRIVHNAFWVPDPGDLLIWPSPRRCAGGGPSAVRRQAGTASRLWRRSAQRRLSAK